LASGTDAEFVLEEARLLGLTGFFDQSVYGALDDYKQFSKRILIDRLVTQFRLGDSELLAFGDGYVEIEDTKAAGGTAIGVASDEYDGYRIDPWKRTRLIRAGADAIAPNLDCHKTLLPFLFGETDSLRSD
jgi:hypothetical protein